MKIIRKILKKSRIYNFFGNSFISLNETIQAERKETQNSINELKRDIQNINNNLYLFNQKLENIYAGVNLTENRTRQFEYINTELMLLNENNKQKILIVGFYGAPNTGDELMLQSLLRKIDCSKYSITVMLADNPNYKLEGYKNVNFIHYPKTNMDINIISNYFDKIVFGGGALLEDTYYSEINAYKFNTASILMDLSTAAILNNKKVYFLALSTSKELTNKSYISKLDYIISNSEYFSLRDKNSLKTLEKSGIKNINKISIINDLVFSLPQIKYDFEKNNNSDEFIVGVILIGLSDQIKLKDLLCWLDEYLVKIKKKSKIRLIPFYDFCNSDTNEFKKLVNELNLNTSVDILPYFQQYEDISRAFSQCNITINMRYHSSLLSLKIGIPSIHIVYDIHSHYENKMNDLKYKYALFDLFVSYLNIDKDIFYKSLDYVINNMSSINLLETNISTTIENDALTEHTNIINNILEN